MSLPVKVVDRIFSRLSATYMAAWDRAIGSAPIADIKSAWAHELAGFAGRLDALAWALENLPEDVPNVIRFRRLARSAPTPDAPRLPEPKADPARVAAELAKLDEVRAGASASPVDHKAWAKRIVARHNAGARLNQTTLRFALEALGLWQGHAGAAR